MWECVVVFPVETLDAIANSLKRSGGGVIVISLFSSSPDPGQPCA